MPCYDLARLLRQFSVDDFVVVKMDIEGSEYDLLKHVLVSGVAPSVDLWAVEFHQNMPESKHKEAFMKILGDKLKI